MKRTLLAIIMAVMMLPVFTSCNYNSLVEKSRTLSSSGQRFRTSISAVPI